ncbi:putative CRISPR-associated protein [Gammaproteobacteria bacterium]
MTKNVTANSVSYIPSPYNFVPLHDNVFQPDWGTPSHDCPFSDAISGELEIKLVAESPIYIRGSDPKPEQLRKEDLSEKPGFEEWVDFYRDAAGKYAIPATSLKGAIRNVIKIAAFGSISEADDQYISVRDLNDKKYTNRFNNRKIQGGWLSENMDGDSEWIITPCKIARVNQCKVRDNDLEGLEEFGRLRLGALGERTSAQEKYKCWDEKNKSRSIHFDTKDIKNTETAINLGKGSKFGTLVFTGQPGNRENKGGKYREFVFYDKEETPIPVSEITQKKFLDTHDGNESWNYWREHLKRGESVPVFWIEDTARPEEPIDAFGLSQLFRLPARSVHDGIPPGRNISSLDVADRLFGTLRGEGFRGRVSFSALACIQEPEEIRFKKHITTVLGGPKPTFYPSYLEQPKYQLPNGKLPGKDNYRTWLSPEICIRGWKRYLVSADVAHPEEIRYTPSIPDDKSEGKNYKVATYFCPLKAGATFVGKIRFHNLRRLELGALIWVLTWGGKAELRHSIGMGKSLGMGRCKISITSESLVWVGDPSKKSQDALDLARCCNDFVDQIDSFLGGKGKKDLYWKELFAMANPANAEKLAGRRLEFPKLSQYENEFRDIKSAGLALPRITEIVDHYLVENRKTESGKPALSELPPEAPKKIVEKPFVPPPRILRVGDIVEGVLIEKSARLFLRPKDHPEWEGGTGIRLDNEKGAVVGDRWQAKVDGTHPNCLFTLLKKIS